jgi:hypothetical protein
MKRLILAVFLGILAAGIFGCQRPEPIREEVLETSDQTIKGDWEEQMPGENK